MAESAYLSIGGGPSYQQHLADLARRAKENPARPTQDPMRDWVPPHARATATAEPEPALVTEEEQEDGSVLVTYDDGSVWRVWSEFNPGTERTEQVFERVEDEDGD